MGPGIKVEAQMYGFFLGVSSLIENCLGWCHRMTPCKGQRKMLNITGHDEGSTCRNLA